MAQTAISIGANTFQFFTRNPRGGKAKNINPADIEAFNTYASSHGIDVILAHASYTLNMASAKEEVRDFALRILVDDLARMENTPNQFYNLHPGSHGGAGIDSGIEKIVEILNVAIRPEQTTTVLLETMTGKGTEIGGAFEDLVKIISLLDRPNHVGVCLDTCHVWDAGYDIVNNLEGVLEEFDRIVGIDSLCAIHLNDSMNICGARKDRHARIGEGHIGFEALSVITNHPQLCSLPFYLETPNKLPGYEEEIARLKEAFLG